MSEISKENFLHELEENLWETWSLFGQGVNSELHKDELYIWYRTPLPVIPYNGVIKFQVKEDVDKTIDRIIAKCSENGRQFMWLVHPSSEPKDLAERLHTRGLIEIELMPGMARTLSDLPEIPPLPKDIEIREAIEKHDIEELVEFSTWRWDIPVENIEIYKEVIAPFKFGHPDAKTRVWQAWKNGKPVSKVAIHRSKNSVGVYAVATRPEARRMGLARIITLTALKAVQAEGVGIAILHSTPMAERLYASMGFEKQADFRLFASVDTHI
jgi:GNAT superfamily N-acetyltransferase